MTELAHELGFDRVVERSNIDDLDDYRPGFRAAQQPGIASPLKDARLTKDYVSSSRSRGQEY